MRILAIGDVCGNVGCNTVKNILPRLKKEKNIDFVVINGENSADGNGITPHSAQMLFSYGADVITGGNHSLKRKEICSVMEENHFLLRPDNLPDELVGKGYCLVDCGYTTVAVINLSGTIYLDNLNASCPFHKADALIEHAKNQGAKIILVDFHAEATSEKRALGIYLDGKISALWGTHTHVQTNDAQILPNGTGYITDLGMTGPIQSVLGVKSSIIISRLKDKNTTEKFVLSDGKCMLNGCIFDIDNNTGITQSVEIINLS
ncbi:MAG: TIGR00282 family metallophosphoesterase [Acutalibacteraceae bacterium]|nr:TIGR00282 family metallophosphoesterase [Acutalibacteraceae bacterium]